MLTICIQYGINKPKAEFIGSYFIIFGINYVDVIPETEQKWDRPSL